MATEQAAATLAELAALSDDRLTAVGLLFEAADGLRDLLASELAPSGLAVPETDVLIRLARSPQHRLRMADLAAQVAMSASGLTRLIDRMESRHLVHREACESDKRGAYATISTKGLAVVTSTLDAHLRVITEAYTGLFTETELAALVGALRRVRAVVRPRATAGVDTTDDAQRATDNLVGHAAGHANTESIPPPAARTAS